MDGVNGGNAGAIASQNGVHRKRKKMDTGLRPPWMEVILGMQEQFPVRRYDGLFGVQVFYIQTESV